MEKIIDSGVSFDENTEGLVIQTYQEIPQEFIDGLKSERFTNSQRRVPNEFHRAASIPVAIVDKWKSEGYDVFTEPVAKSIAKLKTENLDYFITSDKA